MNAAADSHPTEILFQKQVHLHIRNDSPAAAMSLPQHQHQHHHHPYTHHNAGNSLRKQWVTVTVAMSSKSGPSGGGGGSGPASVAAALSQSATPMATTTPTTNNSPLPTANTAISSMQTTWKVLQISLTDETDPFFLFQLEIGEDDFHRLKSEQNLLVDFAEFPFKFVELLEECIAASGGNAAGMNGGNAASMNGGNAAVGATGSSGTLAASKDDSMRSPSVTGRSSSAHHHHSLIQSHNHTYTHPMDNTPKFIAQLHNTSNGRSVFTVVETNTFKHITHLSLHFLPGNDASVKKYLASLVIAFKDQNKHLQTNLTKAEEQLKTEVHQLSSENQHLKQTVDSLRFEASERENRLKLEHAEESSRERERLTREKEHVVRDVESTKSALISRYEQQLGHTTSQVRSIVLGGGAAGAGVSLVLGIQFTHCIIVVRAPIATFYPSRQPSSCRGATERHPPNLAAGHAGTRPTEDHHVGRVW